jgi:uncharacterized protein (TIGR00661 family)
MNKTKKILICPLDWGLGHATRCIRIIKELVKAGHQVVIGADNQPLVLLSQEFPELETIRFPAIPVTYSSGNSQIFKMFTLIPMLLYGIYKEHQLLTKIIRKHNIEVVISDNRFGAWHKSVRSIYITHQVMIKMPTPIQFLEPFFYLLHKWIIQHYDICLIPDFKGNGNLSGDLSHKYPLPKNSMFIGILSRFTPKQREEKKEFIKYDIVVVLSGPEPQRTNLELILLKKLKGQPYKVLIIYGKPTLKEKKKRIDNIQFVSHLPSPFFKSALLSATYVICRSGYSSIMDLIILEKTALLIPTPGQTEQEYLAKYLESHKIFPYIRQNDFVLDLAIKKMKDFKANTFVSNSYNVFLNMSDII